MPRIQAARSRGARSFPRVHSPTCCSAAAAAPRRRPGGVKAAADPVYRHDKAGVDFDIGSFPVDRINPNGGSIALGHPFGSTGARILSQAVKELTATSVGARGVVSVCADGGQGTVALLQRV